MSESLKVCLSACLISDTTLGWLSEMVWLADVTYPSEMPDSRHIRRCKSVQTSCHVADVCFLWVRSHYFTGGVLLFLPPYLPDLNPIEELFSKCALPLFTRSGTDLCNIVKAYLRWHAHYLHRNNDPFAMLIESTGCITAADAQGWIQHAGYIT